MALECAECNHVFISALLVLRHGQILVPLEKDHRQKLLRALQLLHL